MVRIAPGSPLDEIALAERFQISRTPVREALLMLAAEDLVILSPNRTSIVAVHTLDNLGEYIDTLLILSRTVVRSAALNRTSAEIANIRKAANTYKMEVLAGDTEKVLRSDLSMRSAIGHAAHNRFLNRIYYKLYETGIRTRLLHYYPNASRAELEQAAQRMGTLVESIENGDGDLSDRIVTESVLFEKTVMGRCLEPKIATAMTIVATETSRRD